MTFEEWLPNSLYRLETDKSTLNQLKHVWMAAKKDKESVPLDGLVSLPKRELLEKLEFAQKELDMLYYFAISNGIAEAGNPPHKIIADYIKRIKQA